jgi:hypothetical protein
VFVFKPICSIAFTLLLGAAMPQLARAQNVALASAGATASASSVYSGGNVYTPDGAIDGDRTGRTWERDGGWNDDTVDQFPDWLQVEFAGPKTIDKIIVVTTQDDYANPVDPDPSMTFTLFGLSDFVVQYWDGTQWQDIPDGAVAGNRHVLREVNFAPLTTTGVRVLVTGALAGYSRVVEIEAYEPGGTMPRPAFPTASASPRVRLEWDPNSEADLAGYVVLWGTSPGAYTQSWTLAQTATTHEVTGLEWGARYYFAIRAFNIEGFQSLPSDEVSALTPPAPQ